MQAKLEAFLERMQQATTFEDLQGLVTDLRDLYEVEHIVYHSVNGSGQEYAALTYSLDWVTRYLEQNYSRIDPVVLGCFQRFHPVNWKALDWSSRPARAFLGEAVENGIGNQGLSVPIRGPAGQFALFTVNDRKSDAAWDRFSAAHTRELILIAHYLNQKALEIERGSSEMQVQPLSPREVDALTLIGKGLSRGQAAEKLTISEHTLRVYLESARFKLGAANTIHAVALALQRGQILP